MPSRDRPPLHEQLRAPDGASADTPSGLDDQAWVDVIRKMDEVYSQLIADEVELEKKNAALEESQRFIFGLLSSMSDVLLACDRQGRIEQANAALCALIDRDEPSLRGEPIQALMHDDASRQRLAGLMQAQPQPSRDAVELRLHDVRGEAVPVDFTSSGRRDTNGRLIGHVLVGRPVGELKRAYHELRETHEALKRAQQQLLHAEKLASLGRLVAGVAHELNNPISFVLGNVQALERYGLRLQSYLGAIHEHLPRHPAGEQLADERRRLRIDDVMSDLPSLIDGMREGAQRTADIVNGLKRFSVADRGDTTDVDLRGVLERAIHWVRKGSAPHFDVRLQLPDDPPMVRGSEGQLLQVFMNLIQNASDACAGVAAPRLTISVAAGDDGCVRLMFDDNGPGVPTDDRLRIFDPFFSTKPVGQGTGLGLSISYGIIERHHGRIGCDASPEGGARFVIELPPLAASTRDAAARG